MTITVRKGDREIHHNRKALWLLFTLPAIMFAVACFAFSAPANAAQTVPYRVNFQGRITNNSGTILANGTYNMKFRIYDASTSGTLLWNEDRLVASSQGVTVTNGLFSVQLNEVANTMTPSLFTNQNLYLEVELPTLATATTSSPSWTEGAMTRTKLASAGYAFNSDTLDGLDSAAFGQLSSTNAWTAAQSVTVASANAFQVKNGSTNLLNVDTSSSTVSIGTSDTTAAVLVLDTKTSSGDPSAVAGGMYYNSNSGKLRCSQGGVWVDCVSSPTLQNVYDNSASPATITTSAAGKGIVIAAGAVPTADLLSVSNAGQPVTSAGVNALSVNYAGGAAAVEASGVRIDYAPGTTSGGTWSGMRIVANATGATTGVTEYGIKIEGPSSAGAGSEEGVYIGTGWDIGLDVASGGLQLAAQADPATPATGQLRVYAKQVAGRMMLKWVGPSGVDTPAQASFGFNRIAMTTPSGLASAAATTLINSWSTTTTCSLTNTGGTYTNPTLASTNLKASVRRAKLTTSTTSGSIGYCYSPSLMAWRGNAAGIGGFFFTTRFGFGTLASGNRAFVGMMDSTTAPSNVDPTTNTTPGKVGLAINANTGNLKWVNNVTGTTPTSTDLGSSFPVDTTSLYELIIYSPPNGSGITYRVQNLSTGAVTSDTTVTSNIPSNTTFLAPVWWMSNNTSAAAVAIENAGWYLESDN